MFDGISRKRVKDTAMSSWFMTSLHMRGWQRQVGVFAWLPAPRRHGILRALSFEGMDDILAKHFANLYIREPLVVYPDRMEQDDKQSNEHFEVRAATPIYFQALSFHINSHYIY